MSSGTISAIKILTKVSINIAIRSQNIEGTVFFKTINLSIYVEIITVTYISLDSGILWKRLLSFGLILL